MNEKMAVGVIGLGQMGLGMATTLHAKGFAVTGFDLDAERCRLARAAGINVAARPADIHATCKVVIASLPKAAHVAHVMEQEEGFLAKACQRAVFIDTSTSQADISRRLAASAAARGLGFLDAPVSGGPAGARNGTLTMMIGGAPDDLARALPVLEAISAKRLHVGPSGAGNVAKLVNNLLVGINLVAVSEAVALAERAGVSAEAVLSVVNAASGRSAVSEVNYPRWILSGAFDSGFTMGLMRKDIALAADLKQTVGAAGLLSDLAIRLWAESAERLADGDDFNRITQGTPAR